jgi:hypothetical protein
MLLVLPVKMKLLLNAKLALLDQTYLRARLLVLALAVMDTS